MHRRLNQPSGFLIQPQANPSVPLFGCLPGTKSGAIHQWQQHKLAWVQYIYTVHTWYIPRSVDPDSCFCKRIIFPLWLLDWLRSLQENSMERDSHFAVYLLTGSNGIGCTAGFGNVLSRHLKSGYKFPLKFHQKNQIPRDVFLDWISKCSVSSVWFGLVRHDGSELKSTSNREVSRENPICTVYS